MDTPKHTTLSQPKKDQNLVSIPSAIHTGMEFENAESVVVNNRDYDTTVITVIREDGEELASIEIEGTDNLRVIQ